MQTSHPDNHRYEKGGCLYCGYHCVTCPPNVAICKCTPTTPHRADKCKNEHCAIHYFNLYGYGKARFPDEFSILSSRVGWQTIIVYCGPGAYLPKRNKS